MGFRVYGVGLGFSEDFLHLSMDMGFSLGTILRTLLNYERDPYVHVEGSSIQLTLTVAHVK